MKTNLFFQDIKTRSNIVIMNNIDNQVKEKFENKYFQYNDKFFYEQFTRCGGIIVDNWIRLYGCGELNVIEKNEKYNSLKNVDILIGEDVLGGLFGLKDGYVYYFAPDTNEWENMEVYYTQFIDWLINKPNDVNKFYELYRWNNWKEDCRNLKITEGYHFYPLLQSSCDIEKRDRKIISIDELIRFNLNFKIKGE